MKKKSTDGEGLTPADGLRRQRAADELRRQAEERLDALSAATLSAAAAAPAPEDLVAAVHELRVHQIELEMQNEELRRGQLELDAQREKYFALFDLAPVGYLIISDKGIVGDANLTAARLLGVERQLLVGQPFSAFVLAADRDVYYLHSKLLEQTGEPQTCELRLQRPGGGAGGGGADADAAHFWAHLEGLPQRIGDGERLSSWVTFTDISARKRADEELRRSERSLQSTIDGLSASIAVLDDAGVILLVNQPWRAFAEQNGLTPGSVSAGANYLQVCDAAAGEDSEEAAPFAAGIRAVLSAETDSYVLEYPCHSPDEKRWFVGRVTLFPGEGPHRVVVAHEDITARKQAEEELRETRDYLENLFGYANAPIVVWDAEQRITRFNHAFEELTGRTAGEVVGEHLGLLFPEDARRAGALEHVTQASAGERWRVVEIPILRADGEVRIVLWNSATLYADDGTTPVATIAQGQDISERKQAEEALRGSEERFRAMFAGSRDAMMTLAAPSWRFTSGNPAALQMFGARDAAELTALGPWDVSPERQPDGSPSADKALEAIEAALREGSHFFEWTHKRLGGADFPCTVLLTRTEMAGETFVQATVRDITAQKQAEEELARHRQHLERLVAERTDELSEANSVLAERAVEVARSRQNFDTFFNTIDDLLFVLDGDGNIIHVNETVCRRLGYTEEELLGRPVLDVHPPARRDEAGRIVAAMLAGEADFCPVPVVTKGGAEIPVETRVVPGTWDGEPALFGVTKDVTALKISEEKFQRLFHGNPALMAVSSLPERRFTDVNEAFLSALGYSREEVLGHTSEELDLFVEPEQQRAVAEQLQARGRARDRELKVRRKDGTVLDGLFSGEIIESQGQQYFLTVMIDQTEHKQAQEALRDSEALYRSILDASPEGITVTDLEGRVRMASPAGLTLFGNEREEEVVGRSLAEFLVPEDRERAQADFALMLQGAYAGPGEYSGLRADGSTFAVEVNAEFIRDADEQPTGMVFITRDITARKRAEEALRQAADRLSLAARAGGVGVWDLDLAGDTLTWDEQMFALYGVAREQFAGAYEAWQAGLHPDDRERGDVEFQMALRGEKEFDTEFRVVRPDGTVRDIRALALVQRDASGRATRMIGTNWDITEIKLTEQRLLDVNRRLEEAVARANDLAVQAQAATTAKSRFLANMSHEIRTPLNAIIGFAQLMRHDPRLSAQQGDRVAIINRSGEHLLALLSDILELSKAESGRLLLDPTTFDLRELLEDLALVFRARAEAKTLTFGTEGFDGAPRYVVADQLKLRQILTNLLSNAVKFTDTGGVLFRALAVGQGAGAARLVVLVEDTGPGIAADEMDILFAPFEQTTSGRLRGSGTGLGLSISRRFALLMDGDLSVASEVGVGSSFRLEISLAAASEAAAAAAAAADTAARYVLRLAADQSRCRVLVVDDDPDGRTLLRDMLGEAGFDVFEAADGFAAAAFASRRPRLVVMADWIADMAGAAATRRIRQSPGGAEAKIIMLAAGATDEARDQALAAGADAFMAKPFRPAELFEQIRLLTRVRYVYAESAEADSAAAEVPSALTREMMGALPAELREQLREAAVRARHGRLLELAGRVAATDQEAGEELRKLVASFDYAALLRALEQGPS